MRCYHSFTLKLSHYRGRLQHGRHFTFMSATNDSAITLVSPSVNGSIADERHPFAAHGLWLQVLLAEDFIEEMCLDLEELDNPDEVLIICFKMSCGARKTSLQGFRPGQTQTKLYSYRNRLEA